MQPLWISGAESVFLRQQRAVEFLCWKKLSNNSANDELGEKKPESVYIQSNLHCIYTIYNNYCYSSPSFFVCLFVGLALFCFCFFLGFLFVGLVFCWVVLVGWLLIWLFYFFPFLLGLIFLVGRRGNGYKFISSVHSKLWPAPELSFFYSIFHSNCPMPTDHCQVNYP